MLLIMIIINAIFLEFFLFKDSLSDGAILCYPKTDLFIPASSASNTQVSLQGNNCPKHIWNSKACKRGSVYGFALCVWQYRHHKASERLS